MEIICTKNKDPKGLILKSFLSLTLLDVKIAVAVAVVIPKKGFGGWVVVDQAITLQGND